MTEPWEHILQELGYNGQEQLEVTAKSIKACKKSWKGAPSQFEPRLLAYQTSSAARPQVFKDNSLFLLPTRNGTYLLTKKDIYKPLDYSGLLTIKIEKDTSSLILRMGNSETSLIDNLRYSGVFERPEILGEPITHGSLLNGRHRIDAEMKLGGIQLSIRGVQYEVDSCFETKNKILILEGKSGTKEIDSFNIRQLYFPYRAVKAVVGEKKEVLCAFVHQLKQKIHVWLYTFDDPMEFTSIRQTGHFIYTYSS